MKRFYDTLGRPHIINPNHVAHLLLSGGEIKKESVVVIQLSSGAEIEVIGFGRNGDALENVQYELGLD